MASPPEDLLPVLVADLADADAIDVLEAATFSGSKVYLPLDSAPVDATEHVLEVFAPGRAEPTYFLAYPLGPPTDDGFPMKVRHMPNARPEGRSETPAPQSTVMRGRLPTMAGHALSPGHTRDLSTCGPAPTEDPLIGRALAGGKLTIEALIGSGGVGGVYKARHRELRMSVAVKVLHESFQHDIDFCRRFYAEALAASRLDHPNITRVIDFGQEPDGLLYLAMEFLAGMELRAVLQKEQRLSAPRIAELMMQTCAALSQAHARGIVHRDIKPENLVLVPAHDDDGQPIELVKVCDFGIAQHRAAPSAEAQGLTAGTPEYMSPEQCRGDELDQRSDVYSCGVVLYELATGQVPFIAERPESLMNKHQFTPPLPPRTLVPEVDPALERIILSALEKDREKRPQSMRELRAALRELVAPSSREPSPSPASVRGVGMLDALDPGLAGSGSAPELLAADVVSDLEATPPERAAPPPLPKRAAAGSAASGPAWLERGPVYSPGSSGASSGSSGAGSSPSAVVRDDVSAALAESSTALLRQLATTQDRRLFAQLAARLEPSLRALAAQGDVHGLWQVLRGLHDLSMQGSRGPGSRAFVAAALMRVFEDPNLLGGVAEQLLAGPTEARDDARRVLVHAGVAGAYGLYGARVKLANDPNVRAPFMASLKDFGPKAWPVVRTALEKLVPMSEASSARALQLAEDLLLCVPSIGDESAGHLVVKYLRVNVAGVCRAATAAIIQLWAERAKPLLVGMLQSSDDMVRIAGIAGLRQLGEIDEHVIPRLHAILTRRIPAGEELRAAAAVALSHVRPSAKQPAVSLLAQLVAPGRDAVAPPRSAVRDIGQALSREDAVLLATARSLLVVGGQSYRALVADRADRSAEPLRSELKKLLVSG